MKRILPNPFAAWKNVDLHSFGEHVAALASGLPEPREDAKIDAAILIAEALVNSIERQYLASFCFFWGAILFMRGQALSREKVDGAANEN